MGRPCRVPRTSVEVSGAKHTGAGLGNVLFKRHLVTGHIVQEYRSWNFKSFLGGTIKAIISAHAEETLENDVATSLCFGA